VRWKLQRAPAPSRKLEFHELWAWTWASHQVHQVHQKERWPAVGLGCYPPRSTILPNFIALRQPTPHISVTKVFAHKETKKQSYKQTLNGVSPACLSTCGDIRITNVRECPWLSRNRGCVSRVPGRSNPGQLSVPE